MKQGRLEYYILRDILDAQGGQNKWAFGDTKYRIWRKIVLNQSGTFSPSNGDLLITLIKKAYWNKFGQIDLLLGDSEQTIITKLLLYSGIKQTGLYLLNDLLELVLQNKLL